MKQESETREVCIPVTTTVTTATHWSRHHLHLLTHTSSLFKVKYFVYPTSFWIT